MSMVPFPEPRTSGVLLPAGAFNLEKVPERLLTAPRLLLQLGVRNDRRGAILRSRRRVAIQKLSDAHSRKSRTGRADLKRHNPPGLDICFQLAC